MRGVAGKMFRLSYDSFANSKMLQSFANEVCKTRLSNLSSSTLIHTVKNTLVDYLCILK